MSAPTECSVCKRDCTTASFPRVSDLPILGYDADGNAVCQLCDAEIDRARLTRGESVTAYLSSDGRRITTWPGELLARVTSEGSAANGWNGSRITYWRAVTSDGVEVYGKNGGRGMVTRVRVAKVKVAA